MVKMQKKRPDAQIPGATNISTKNGKRKTTTQNWKA
jgi:hypothetical protein